MKKTGWKEMFAALGVIASLLFVGLEIRENTRAVRGAAIQAIAESSSQYTYEMVQDEHWVRLMAAFSFDTVTVASLSPEDRIRLDWGLTAATRIQQNRFRQYELGILRSEEMLQVGGANQNFYSSRVYCDWWPMSQPETRFPADFVDFMQGSVMSCAPS